jgi:hypothetical protein
MEKLVVAQLMMKRPDFTEPDPSPSAGAATVSWHFARTTLHAVPIATARALHATSVPRSELRNFPVPLSPHRRGWTYGGANAVLRLTRATARGGRARPANQQQRHINPAISGTLPAGRGTRDMCVRQRHKGVKQQGCSHRATLKASKPVPRSIRVGPQVTDCDDRVDAVNGATGLAARARAAGRYTGRHGHAQCE